MAEYLARALRQKAEATENANGARTEIHKYEDRLRRETYELWIAVAKIHGFNVGYSGRDVSAAHEMVREELAETAVLNTSRAEGGFSSTNLDQQIQREIVLGFMLPSGLGYKSIMGHVSRGYAAGEAQKANEEQARPL